MITIEVRFPAGRFHGTPWDRQVNEGEIEWPPSHWRILRTLISSYYMKNRVEIDEGKVAILLKKLSIPPEYYLPKGVPAHTRHYMPPFKGNTNKVFDSFIRVDENEPLLIGWPELNITPEERKILELLLDRTTYLGRAESWADMKLVERTFIPNCKKAEGDIPQDTERIRCLSVQDPLEYDQWRTKFIEEQSRKKLEEKKKKSKGKTSEKVKLSFKEKDQIERLLPSDLFEALCGETADLKKEGWSQPPGSQWLDYFRPVDIFKPKPGKRSRINPKNTTIARFAVSCQAPPRLTEAVSVAERLHQALVSYSDHSMIFTGCDENKKPLQGHNHAFILCESIKAQGKGHRGDITHISIYTPKGFDPISKRALGLVKKVWGHGGNDIQLILLGYGDPIDFGGFNVTRSESPLMAESKIWISRTPFVPTRHQKATRTGIQKKDDSGYQIGSPEHDLLRLLKLNGFPLPVKINRIESTDLGGHTTHWLEFRRERKMGGGKKAGDMGYGFKIEFAEPVRGPIALGYGAHFGLGSFIGIENK